MLVTWLITPGIGILPGASFTVSHTRHSQSPFARRVHPTIMWAKLKSLVEGARIATGVLWGKQAAA
jgi:hypothetical protein